MLHRGAARLFVHTDKGIDVPGTQLGEPVEPPGISESGIVLGGLAIDGRKCIVAPVIPV